MRCGGAAYRGRICGGGLPLTSPVCPRPRRHTYCTLGQAVMVTRPRVAGPKSSRAYGRSWALMGAHRRLWGLWRLWRRPRLMSCFRTRLNEYIGSMLCRFQLIHSCGR